MEPDRGADIGFSTGFRRYLCRQSRPGPRQLRRFEPGYLITPSATITAPYASRPFPQLSQILTVENLEREEQLQRSYLRSESPIESRPAVSKQLYLRPQSLRRSRRKPDGFCRWEIGSNPSDRFHPGLDYGKRGLYPAQSLPELVVYQLPLDRGGSFWAQATTGLLNNAVGGWADGRVPALPKRSFPNPFGQQFRLIRRATFKSRLYRSNGRAYDPAARIGGPKR